MSCQNEGRLRAFLDGELAPEEMAGLTAHLRECPDCERQRRELAGRAAFVSVLMNDLKVEAPRVVEMHAPRPRVHWRRWTGIAAVVAAGFVLGILSLPKKPEPVAVVPSKRAVTVPPVEEPVREEPIRVASVPTPVRVTRSPAKRDPISVKTPKLSLDGFITLDDEPFEAGMLVRVTLGAEQIPADVVFSADGRARAYRLVNDKANE